MRFGRLNFEPVSGSLGVVAKPVADALRNNSKEVYVAEIDPSLADTTAFCEHYDVSLGASANCIILEAKRADRTWYVAVVVLATMRADVNGIIRRHIDASKTSFAPMDKAVALTGMEYGGITPLGLPADWQVLIDEHVAKSDQVIIGSGTRGSKLLIPGSALGRLPNAQILDLVQHQQ